MDPLKNTLKKVQVTQPKIRLAKASLEFKQYSVEDLTTETPSLPGESTPRKGRSQSISPKRSNQNQKKKGVDNESSSQNLSIKLETQSLSGKQQDKLAVSKPETVLTTGLHKQPVSRGRSKSISPKKSTQRKKRTRIRMHSEPGPDHAPLSVFTSKKPEISSVLLRERQSINTELMENKQIAQNKRERLVVRWKAAYSVHCIYGKLESSFYHPEQLKYWEKYMNELDRKMQENVRKKPDKL